jgi:nicotinamidase-related amidase
MAQPETLLQLAKADLTPARLANASLVLIDLQNEYVSGPLALREAGGAIANAAALLARAREAGTPVFHVAHRGRQGGMFDRSAERGAIVAQLTPIEGEVVIEKELPNAFAKTDLEKRLQQTGRKEIILVGMMTHMCVSSTARAALDLGFRTTIDATACATRDLPDGQGATIPARTVHEVALAELSDRFAIIARDGRAIS